MKMKIYADRMSQPSRAIIIFCKANGIDFEEIKVDLAKREHRLPEFLAVNPFGQVPTIVDGRFKLFESHAILSYIAGVFAGVADHWYPELFKKAKINLVLDWHHANLRRGAGLSVGLLLSTQAASEAKKNPEESLTKLESYWLKGNGKFLLGSLQPYITDLSLVCQLTQLELLYEKDRNRILGPRTRVLQWIEDTKIATSSHFEQVHKVLFKGKARLHKLTVGENYDFASSIKAICHLPSNL